VLKCFLRGFLSSLVEVGRGENIDGFRSVGLALGGKMGMEIVVDGIVRLSVERATLPDETLSDRVCGVTAGTDIPLPVNGTDMESKDFQ